MMLGRTHWKRRRTMGIKNVSAEAIGSVPSCHVCGSQQVVRAAWAVFNPDSGLYEVETTEIGAHCRACEDTTTLVWSEAIEPPNKRVRELNDRFRTIGQGTGSLMLTSGIQAEGVEFVRAAVSAAQTFTDFSNENDPWGEHDFGAVDVSGHKVFFKFDYYDPTCTKGSENPGNEAVTHRVLTIMLASEY
jgi:hypothetical protein